MSKVKEEISDFAQIYIILVQTLTVIKGGERKICATCHDQVQWVLEPKYYYNKQEPALNRLPITMCPNLQVRTYIEKRIQMVYDTLYFLESAFLKLKVSSYHCP